MVKSTLSEDHILAHKGSQFFIIHTRDWFVHASADDIGQLPPPLPFGTTHGLYKKHPKYLCMWLLCFAVYKTAV